MQTTTLDAQHDQRCYDVEVEGSKKPEATIKAPKADKTKLEWSIKFDDYLTSGDAGTRRIRYKACWRNKGKAPLTSPITVAWHVELSVGDLCPSATPCSPPAGTFVRALGVRQR